MPTTSDPDAYNMELARQRAETVRDFLVKYGAQASQFTHRDLR